MMVRGMGRKICLIIPPTIITLTTPVLDHPVLCSPD
jgi:hypothetical protein